MTSDRSFIEKNRASTERMQALAERLSDKQLQLPVGQHWNVALVYAHLAFLDRRALYVLDETEREGKVVNPDWDIFVNDLVLPLFAAIPPREAVRIAIEEAERIDRRLEGYPERLLDLVLQERRRYVFRADHRNEHLDEAEAALNEAARS